MRAASPTPRPGPHAGDPAASGAMAARTRRADSIPPTQRHPSHRLKQDHGEREGGGEIRPAGHRSDRAGACGHRAGVPRWGVAGVVSYEQRGAPPRDVPARSHAQAGRRAGLDAQPERLLPARGAKQSHAVKREKGPPRHRQNNRLHAVTRTKPAAHPSGNNEASRSDERKADSESAGQQEGSRSEKREPGHTPAWQNESPLGRGKINPGRRASP